MLVQNKVKQLKTEYNQLKTEQTDLTHHAISDKTCKQKHNA